MATQLFLTSALLLTAVRAQSSVEPVILPGPTEGPRACPVGDVIETTTSGIFENIETQIMIDCGGLGWRQVADLDMEDTAQHCPSPWQETSNLGRSCRPSISTGECEGVTFPVSGGTYTRVCGRVTGLSNGTPDGFFRSSPVDGVTVTYGPEHIWSFAASHSAPNRCPCDNNDRQNAPLPAVSVGDNYFCDGMFNGALWDGEDCSTACCTFNSPPYFTVTLPTPTTEDIVVSICSDEGRGNERIQVQLLEIFVR